MAEKKEKNKNFLSYILVVVLVAAAFVIGNLYNRIRTLEKKTTDGSVAGQTQEPTPLENLEIEITENDPSIGPSDAKATLVLFSDFLCPFCSAYSGESEKLVEMMKSRDSEWEPALPNIIKDYALTNKVQVVWKDLPYHGDEAFVAHAAAKCAHEQGKFWEYHNELFALAGQDDPDYSQAGLKNIASKLTLDLTKFNSCLESGKYQEEMKEAVSFGQSKGIDGTPATFINGKLVSGAVPYSQFKKLIDEELAK